MNKFAMKDFSDAIEALLRGSAADKCMQSVTIFCSPLSNCKQRVTATYHGKPDSKNTRNTIVLSYGVLNYAQREYLALCKSAKCNPRRLWFKFYPKKKRTA